MKFERGAPGAPRAIVAAVDCRSWSRVVCAVLTPLCLARGAGAQISWHGAERCGPSAEQAAAAERALADPGAPRVDVALSEQGARWTAKLQASYANGSVGVREISARSCAQLLGGVSVALSLLEPTAQESESDVTEAAGTAAVESATPEPAGPEPAPPVSAAAVSAEPASAEPASAQPASAQPPRPRLPSSQPP